MPENINPFCIPMAGDWVGWGVCKGVLVHIYTGSQVDKVHEFLAVKPCSQHITLNIKPLSMWRECVRACVHTYMCGYNDSVHISKVRSF